MSALIAKFLPYAIYKKTEKINFAGKLVDAPRGEIIGIQTDAPPEAKKEYEEYMKMKKEEKI